MKKITRELREKQMQILDEIEKICEKHNLIYFLSEGTLLGAIRHKGFIPWDDDLDISMPREDYEKFKIIAMNELNKKHELDYFKTNKHYFLPFIKVREKKTIYLEKKLINYMGLKGIFVDIFPLDDTKKPNSYLMKFQSKLEHIIAATLSFKSRVIHNRSKKEKVFLTLLSVLPFKFLVWLQDKVMTFQNNSKCKYFASYGITPKKKPAYEKEKLLPTKKAIYENRVYNIPNDSDYYLKVLYGDYMTLPPKEKRKSHKPIKIEFDNRK